MPPVLPDSQTLAEEFSEFAYVVSHDLSAPLRGIVEFSKLLKLEEKNALSEEGKEYLSLIVESAEKLQSLLAGLLDYSRLNTMGKSFSRVDCNRIIRDCEIVLQNDIKANHAQLDIANLPTVAADAEQLMQLFLALLGNAIKFHKPGKPAQVKLFAEEMPQGWAFTVQDDGIGIDAEFHRRIFQPLQRLHTAEEYPGIGMGLTLARKIAERHGGTINVKSSPGKGATFTFILLRHELPA